MRIGIFTDTYFPQVSGVATSTKTLKTQLENRGHEVIMFTTTDPNAAEDEEDNIIRLPSVPFVSFKDRRIIISGMRDAYKKAKAMRLDLIHTQTEFGTGILGKFVAKQLKIPCIHTYHTMYEDYLHYIAHGKLIKPRMVKAYFKFFSIGLSGIVCPSERVLETMQSYNIDVPLRIIPTGIEIEKFLPDPCTKRASANFRYELGFQKDDLLLLSLSRVSYEKNIQAVIHGMPEVLRHYPKACLLIVGKGPYTAELKELAQTLGLGRHVRFIGEVPHDEVSKFYQSADYFVSASTSESQGLTYIEAIAAGCQAIVAGNHYIDNLFNDLTLGETFRGDKEFAPTLLHYIDRGLKFDPAAQQKMLREISAETFGDRVIEFYDSSLRYFEDNLLADYEKRIPREKEKIKFFRR